MFTHILIPTDGSHAARKAIRRGIALARACGAKVTGYHALLPVLRVDDRYSYLVDRNIVADANRENYKVAQKMVAEIGASAFKAGVGFAPLITQADTPYAGIIDAARKRRCDLIVLGARGLRGLPGLLLGSVTQKVIARSKVPVLVYR